jgi:hypothetical protein
MSNPIGVYVTPDEKKDIKKSSGHWEFRKISVYLKTLPKAFPSRKTWEGLRDGTIDPKVVAAKVLGIMYGGKK